jgi:hypothetical protein
MIFSLNTGCKRNDPVQGVRELFLFHDRFAVDFPSPFLYKETPARRFRSGLVRLQEQQSHENRIQQKQRLVVAGSSLAKPAILLRTVTFSAQAKGNRRLHLTRFPFLLRASTLI